MSDAVKSNIAWAVEIESTEGTYVAPTGVTSYLQVLKDGAELSPSKELLERNVFTGSLKKVTPRTGQFQVSGTLPVEARAFSTAGSAPEYDALMRAALGTRRQASTTTTTKASGNTASVLQIEDADISKFNTGDIVLVKMDDAYHVSPISAKSTGTGTATITLLIPHPSGDIDDSVVIEKFTTYTVADSGHPTLSVSKYLEGTKLESAVGCRVTSMALENFSTGQMPNFSFSFEGLNYSSSLTSIPHTPSYDSALPPIILSAKMYMDTTALEVNEVSFAVENTLGFKTATSASNGRVSSRITDRSITGSFNPYKAGDSIANYTKYANNTEFALFGYAMVPTGTDGEFGNIVAFYLPKCVITEMSEADQDGLLQDSISFQASGGAAGTTNEIYISII